MTHQLDPLLRPRSVAIVGASTRPDSVGSNLIVHLRDSGFAGPIYPVNPRYPEIHGHKAYPKLADIGAPIDAVFIAVASEYGPGIMSEAIAAGARSVLLNAAGYAEGGPEGVARQRDIADQAAAAGIPVCGPNNLGLVNVIDRLPLWAAGHLPSMTPGPIAVISQSGSVALALGEDPAGLGLAYLITAGNEAVTGVGSYLDAIAEDSRVRTVLLFLETIRDPRGLAAAAAKARAAGQTILAVKVGRSAAARAAVAAHSGALSGEDRVVDAYFARNGIVRCRSLDDMVQLAGLSLVTPPAPQSSAAFITLSGGQGASIADFAADAGLALADFTPAVAAALAPEFGGAPAHNPLDAWGLGWDTERFGRIFDTLLAAQDVDPIVFTLDTPATGQADTPMAEDMVRIAATRVGHGKTVILSANSAISGVAPNLDHLRREAGMPLLMGLDAAMRALAAWTAPSVAVTEAAEAGGSLGVAEVKSELARAVSFVTAAPVSTAAEAVERARQWRAPIALKGIAPGALHKTELGLVRLAVSGAAIATAFDDIAANLARHEATIGAGHIEAQPMIPAGLELLVAARRDPQFGPVTVVGAGGTLVELIGDSALRLGAVDAATAAAMLAETRIGTLLAGYRDTPARDAEVAVAAIVAVSNLLNRAGPEVTAIEINPLIVLAEGEGAVAVDLIVE